MGGESLASLRASSFLHGEQAAYVETLYEAYLQDPDTVSKAWRECFDSFSSTGKYEQDVSHQTIQKMLVELSSQPQKKSSHDVDQQFIHDQTMVDQLIHTYRLNGHLDAHINPLDPAPKPSSQHTLAHYGLEKVSKTARFRAPYLMGSGTFTLDEIHERLNRVYCGKIGFEFMHVTDSDERMWLQQRIESPQGDYGLPLDEKHRVLEMLIKTEGLEKYLGGKYVGQKRFSLEGCDSFVPLMDMIVQYSSQQDVRSVVVGMAHRGRLNMLVNVCGQAPKELFQEFEGKREVGLTSGDVKYHLGFSSDVATKDGSMHVSLAFNPSHLEFISAVAMGSVRARQDILGDVERAQVLPVVVHGDASFSGQGIVMETLNMSQTRAYEIGGSVHIVINNQIGFTCSLPDDSRSSLYCTDVAKMIEAPVFHVNADDVEAVVFLAKLAVDYRRTFKKDIVIDLVGYRRHGHNEADEPAATQPMMYKKIRSHDSACSLYVKRLIEQQVVSQETVNQKQEDYRKQLDAGSTVVNLVQGGLSAERERAWAPYIGTEWTEPAETAVNKKKLTQLGDKITKMPNDFSLQRQVGNMIKSRQAMIAGEQAFDWGCAESLAYASLLDEGYPVRISGQDSQRGTFSHRFAVLHNNENGETFLPFADIASDKAPFEIYNSLLSESAVLGFEYGYAASKPEGLTIWEAQFGDFANGAQVIIDQFLSSGWQKWGRLSGVVLFLPHGYEGMGPEHSSARLERFLQLCAQDNLQVCVPSTPSQIFHLIRRQVLRPYRKPLIVMTPKSLLRHKRAVSSYEDLTSGQYELVIPDSRDIDPKKTKRLVLCCGKVYYDLLEAREELDQTNIALVRVEQLYPFPQQALNKVVKRYAGVKDVVWCQEEPKNQGAWYCIRHYLEDALQADQTLSYCGRDAAAAPAAGYPKLHKKQQEEFINQALSLSKKTGKS